MHWRYKAILSRQSGWRDKEELPRQHLPQTRMDPIICMVARQQCLVAPLRVARQVQNAAPTSPSVQNGLLHFHASIFSQYLQQKIFVIMVETQNEKVINPKVQAIFWAHDHWVNFGTDLCPFSIMHLNKYSNLIKSHV